VGARSIVESSHFSITYDEFASAVAMLETMGYPLERTAPEAWPHFRGWRANYDAPSLALAKALDAPPALWSGSRRWPSQPIPPKRPTARAPRETT